MGQWEAVALKGVVTISHYPTHSPVSFPPLYINTRYKYNLYLLSTNLSKVQKGVLFSGSKIYNHLPLNIKLLSKDIKHFKTPLRSYLTEHAFYSIDEYYKSTSP
jgi:hypothetical protein